MFDAIRGLREKEDEQLQVFQYWVREICYYTAAPHAKEGFKRKDIFGELEIDREMRKRRVKNMKPIEVTVDGKAQ